MTGIRQRIAERLVAAQSTAAILTTFNEADLSAVLDLRARYKEAFQKKHGVGLGFMSFFVKAAVEALRAFPAVNDQVVVRPMMYLALSYDHRLIDGREAVQFLVRVKECVENPERMLLEV